MQLISPWRRGDSRSLFVATVTVSRFDRLKMAAPKSLLPEETCDRVSGTIDDSVTESSVDTRSSEEYCALPILRLMRCEAVDGENVETRLSISRSKYSFLRSSRFRYAVEVKSTR